MLTKIKGFNRKWVSNPDTFTYKFQKAEVAQSVEQGTENPRVGSSILSLGTSKIKGLQRLIL